MQDWAGGDPTQTMRPIIGQTWAAGSTTAPTAPYPTSVVPVPSNANARFNDAGGHPEVEPGDPTKIDTSTVLMGETTAPTTTADADIHARGSATPSSQWRLSTPLPPRQLTDNPLLLGCQEIDYDLLDVVGHGGMGVVHRAHQRRLALDIAVKRIRPGRLSAQADAQRRQIERQFVAESLITGHLDHPNIVPVYDLGLDAHGQLYLTMKLVGGRPWARLLHPRSEEDRRAAETMDQTDHLQVLLSVCNALVFAHDRHILHRDLKPGNVMIGRYGEVLVMDWGMAAQFGPLADDQLRAPHVREIQNTGARRPTCHPRWPAVTAPSRGRGPIPTCSVRSSTRSSAASRHTSAPLCPIPLPPRPPASSRRCLRR
ncbi:MAG: protein kinase domain-containing protein [Planctomycetota bacterium]